MTGTKQLGASDHVHMTILVHSDVSMSPLQPEKNESGTNDMLQLTKDILLVGTLLTRRRDVRDVCLLEWPVRRKDVWFCCTRHKVGVRTAWRHCLAQSLVNEIIAAAGRDKISCCPVHPLSLDMAGRRRAKVSKRPKISTRDLHRGQDDMVAACTHSHASGTHSHAANKPRPPAHVKEESRCTLLRAAVGELPCGQGAACPRC